MTEPAVAAAAPPAAIELRGVEKRFGDLVAVRSLDLVVPRGAIYGFIGPNGAGKTTTIRMIMDIFAPDRGEIELFGAPRNRQSAAQIGYLPEERGLYPKMKVAWTLEYLARLKGLRDRRLLRAAVQQWLERMGLWERRDDRVEALSKGNQQKIQIAATLIHDPELVILDEPFSGLDPVNAELCAGIVHELEERGKTVIFSTHVMEQAEKLCHSVVMIARGEKVLDGPLPAIKARFGRGSFAVELEGDAAATVTEREERQRMLAALGCVERVEARREGARRLHEVFLRDGQALPDLLHALASVRGVRRVERLEPSLHAIFVMVAGQDPNEAALGAGAGAEGAA